MDQPIIFKHYQQLSKTDLKKAVKSYRKGLHRKETKSCIILWSELKKLVADTEKIHGKDSVDGLRIYFYRADASRVYKMPKQKIQDVDGRTQMGVILVPMNKYNYAAPAIAYDMFDKDENIWALTPGGEHTGLCPTNCGGSI